jgi:RNA polymerase sigma-70 factor (ECF subfamily)
MGPKPADVQTQVKSVSHATDRELLGDVAAGDQRAFRLIYDRHIRSVYQYALAILRDEQSATDCVQEVWMALWRSRHRIQLVSDNVLPWLLVTTRHKALNSVAARQRQGKLHNTLANADGGQSDPIEWVEREALQAHVDEFVHSMSDLDQQIFVLCVSDGLSYAAVAERLTVSEGVVRNRLSRLKVKLRLRINAYGETR